MGPKTPKGESRDRSRGGGGSSEVLFFRDESFCRGSEVKPSIIKEITTIFKVSIMIFQAGEDGREELFGAMLEIDLSFWLLVCLDP